MEEKLANFNLLFLLGAVLLFIHGIVVLDLVIYRREVGTTTKMKFSLQKTMDHTVDLEPIIRQIERHRDREINKILGEARGQFSSGILVRVLEEYTGELSQKSGDFVSAGIPIDEIGLRLDATVKRAMLFLSEQFERRGLAKSTAY